MGYKKVVVKVEVEVEVEVEVDVNSVNGKQETGNGFCGLPGI